MFVLQEYYETMRQLLSILIFTMLITACSTVDDESRPEARVNDKTGVLAAEFVRELDDTLESYEKQTCHQIAVLVIASTNGEPIESFSLKTANQWGIGYKGLENGILVVIAIDDKHLRIEVGNGLTKYLTNKEAYRIIYRDMVPEFKSGNYVQGLKQGIASIMQSASLYTIPAKLRPKICAGS